MTTADAIRVLIDRSPPVYSIPGGQPFLAEIASFLHKAYSDDPMAIADLTVFLPNRRAVRGLSLSFQSLAAPGQSVLLPRLRSLGDVAEEDLLFSGPTPPGTEALRPAAPAPERRLALAHFVRQKRQNDGRSTRWPSALRAADDLGGMLDSFYTEGVSFDQLPDLVPADVVDGAAAHWQTSLEFLKVVSEQWPAFLSNVGWVEAAERQTALLDALADAIAQSDVDDPVILAGSLGTVPATSRLMSVVAASGRGAVILPGLDMDMDDRAWECLDPPHPQALLRERLDKAFGGVNRSAVGVWPGTDDKTVAARRQFLSLALRPAAATDDWVDKVRTEETRALTREAINGFHIAVAETENEEADFIALLVREALSVPERSVMVVTPDRELARRVAMKLSVWGLSIDDSGGIPVSGTYRGTFLRLVAAWLVDPTHPTHLIDLLSHDLTSAAMEPGDLLPAVRELDRLLRGHRQAWKFAELIDHMTARKAPQKVLTLLSELHRWTEDAKGGESLHDRMRRHVRCAEWLAATPNDDGGSRLWRFEDGEALAALFDAYGGAEFLPGDLDDEDYPAFFEGLLAGTAVRKRGGHPRVQLLGLMEARLQHADLVILSGLSDGVWPDEAATDSFLSRPMRAALGLPSPEQMIGRSAHDFAQAAALPNVVLTRSSKRGGTAAPPSRWMVRLHSLLNAASLLDAVDMAPRLRALIHHRLVPVTSTKVSAPTPRPPVAARPKDIRVTDISTLIRDPYAFYAKEILHLRKWRCLDSDIDARVRGTFFHKVLEDVYSDEEVDDVGSAIGTKANALLAQDGFTTSTAVLWSVAIDRMVKAVPWLDAHVFDNPSALHMECAGKITIELKDETLSIRGRADRLDIVGDQQAGVIDYKTSSSLPTFKQSKSFDPQLALLAIMARDGGFADLPAATPASLAYVFPMAKFGEAVKGKAVTRIEGPELEEHLKDVMTGVNHLLVQYRDPTTAFLSKPRTFFVKEYGDYDHLARRGEWARFGGSEDDS